MFKKLSITTTMAIAFMSFAVGQIRTPAPSPSATVKQTIGLTDVKVEYSRPSVKGRTIFAEEGLVPFGKMWRTGANAATKISFSDDVTVEGKELAKGSYALITKPGAEMWDVHFYPYESGSWGSYLEAEPAAAVTVKSVALPMGAESFLIFFDELTNEGAQLGLMWDKTYIPLSIGVNVDERVMADIDRVLSGPSANDYYTAGSYYYTAGKDLNKALEYVQKATHVDEPRFWQVRREALILEKLGRKDEAIAAAKKSLELAKAAGNDDYVRMNEKSIEKWSM